jgi:hypothetical protein
MKIQAQYRTKNLAMPEPVRYWYRKKAMQSSIFGLVITEQRRQMPMSILVLWILLMPTFARYIGTLVFINSSAYKEKPTVNF